MKWSLTLHSINDIPHSWRTIVKLNKSLLTCAIVMALGINQQALAAETEKGSVEQVQNDFMIDAVGNVILLSQTSESGAVFGNEVILSQEGDNNGINASLNGESNITEITQIGADNIAIATSLGDANTQIITQDGDGNELQSDLIGNDNEVNTVQNGTGYLGIDNRIINKMEGDDLCIGVT